MPILGDDQNGAASRGHMLGTFGTAANSTHGPGVASVVIGKRESEWHLTAGPLRRLDVKVHRDVPPAPGCVRVTGLAPRQATEGRASRDVINTDLRRVHQHNAKITDSCCYPMLADLIREHVDRAWDAVHAVQQPWFAPMFPILMYSSEH
ncbi:unnamed protein product, partial [Iphiclides podalirius]